MKVYLLFFFLEATIGFWALDCSPDYLSKADQIVPKKNENIYKYSSEYPNPDSKLINKTDS